MDYMKCPNYFYRKNILGTVAMKNSPALIVGDAVDSLLAQIEMSKRIAVFEGDRRTKNGKAEYASLIDDGFTIVTQAQYDQIIALSDSVMTTTAYKQLADYKKQEILEMDMDIGQYFNKLAGMPDFIKVDDDKISIVDLKTAQTIEKHKYYWHADAYGYFLQAAVYCLLANNTYPNRQIIFQHLVVEKSEPYRVVVYTIPQVTIDKNIEMIYNVIDQIKNDKEFKKKDVSLDDAKLLSLDDGDEAPTIDDWV